MLNQEIWSAFINKILTQITGGFKSLLKIILGVKKYATIYFKPRVAMNSFEETTISYSLHTFRHPKIH